MTSGFFFCTKAPVSQKVIPCHDVILQSLIWWVCGDLHCSADNLFSSSQMHFFHQVVTINVVMEKEKSIHIKRDLMICTEIFFLLFKALYNLFLHIVSQLVITKRCCLLSYNIIYTYIIIVIIIIIVYYCQSWGRPLEAVKSEFSVRQICFNLHNPWWTKLWRLLSLLLLLLYWYCKLCVNCRLDAQVLIPWNSGCCW